MKNIVKANLTKLGIKRPHKIYHNLSYKELFKHEVSNDNNGYEKGVETSSGAVSVDTGIFTGRSPKDKYIVKENYSKNYIWWSSPISKSSDNKPINKGVWDDLLTTSVKQFSGKKLYVQDGYAGANENTRLKIRVITEVAWMAHFVKNMFLRPTEEELKDFKPDFILINACKATNKNWEKHDLYSDVYIAFNLQEKMALIGGTWYGGEIKKGIFSIMNYYLPRRNIASMHCSANMGKNGDTALFFGLSGTGKTTLSTDPNRFLIGDDEHGWDDEGVFNLEGGCYAKCINLSPKKEPDIFKAIRRDALLENAVVDENGKVNYFDKSKTENIRVSYPIYHINNIVKPISKGKHPNKIIFLTADAFGVFPPVSKLTLDQAKYFFLSGYTSKLAGTERGIREPIPTFSPGFGAAFLLLHPTVYAEILAKKMREHGTTAYLVNTGWVGGDYVRGNRIDLTSTRKIITAILDGVLDNCKYVELPTFGLHIPTRVPGVNSKLLNPRRSWKYESRYVKQATMLAEKFIENFQSFTDTEEGKRLISAGPKNIQMKQFYDYYSNRIETQEQRYREELQRLKDHIYILQESFKDYISFNSINTDFKKAKVNRYIPVVSFFNSKDKKKVEELNKEVNNILSTINYKYYTEEDHDAKYNKFIAISKIPVSRIEEKRLLKKLFRSVNNINGRPSDIKVALKKFYQLAETVDDSILKIGSYLIIKKAEEDDVKWMAKELSIAAQIYIDKNPEILKSSYRMFNELTAFLT